MHLWMTRTFRSTACWFSLSKKMPLKTNRLHALQSTKEDASLPVNVSEFEHEFRQGCIFAISTHRSRPRAARTFVTHHKAELLFLTKTKRNMFLDLDGREQKTWNISLVEFQLLFNYFIVRNFLGVAIIINYWNLCPLLFPGFTSSHAASSKKYFESLSSHDFNASLISIHLASTKFLIGETVIRNN